MNKKSPHTDITNPQTSLEEIDDKMETLVVEQLDDLDPTDEELDEILDNLDDDSSWEWDDDQLELDLDEDRNPLTLGQRMKRRILMKRLAPKIARQRKIKMRRKAGKEDLQKRARKAAVMILKKKVAGAKGADYKNLSPSEKIGIDKLVQKRLGAVDKIAKRLMPKILKKETERVQSMRSSKVNEEFETLIEKKVAQDPDVDERPGTQPKKYFSGVRKKSKEVRARHFEKGAKMDDDNPAAYKPAPGDAGAKTKPSKHTKKFKQMFGEQKMECPPATKDVALNTKNRNATRDNHMYGPLNVKEPGDYWEKLADKWDTTVEAAKKSKCGSCVAFDISPRMEECMPGSVSDESGRLGYCWMHHFKCHSARSCDTWATGGPIKEDEKSYQWQEKAFGKKEDISEEVTAKQISDLEKFGDRLLGKFGIDVEFSKHFADRMNDDRNNPEIKVAEIQSLFKKIARKKAANIKKHANSEVVLKDIQKDLNLPVAIKMDKNGDIEVVHKTIMRKKNFKTPNAVVQYEDVNEAFEAEYLEEKQIDALKKKSEKTKIPYGILKKVYDRGMAAWRTGHRPGTTPQQWAFARVNSFATKSKGTWGGADKDLAAKVRSEEVNEADPCWDGYKQVGMKKNAAGKDVPNCVPESVDEKVEFETDKDLPNLRKPKKTTNYEFRKYVSKLKGAKSRERDYFKSNPRFEENGGAGEEGTEKLVKKYKKDTPSQMDERKSPYQKLRDFDKSRQAVGKKSMFNDKPTEFVRMKKPGAMTTMNVPSNEIDKYVKMGYKAIKENDAVNALKKDHNKEKEALKDKHDREMDTARLRDTRAKNLDEAFEMSMQTQAGMGETMFAKDFMQIRAGYEHHPDVEEALEEDYGWEEETDFVVIDEGAAEYQGRKVDLNNPTKSDNPKKKYMVYVKNDKGNVVKVHFGDPNMSIKRDDPERRKSFRARHGCDVDPGPKWKAKYWSCKFWSTKSVSDLMKG